MIARELLVKLGFDIDEAKYARFMKMSDNLKTKAQGIGKNIIPPIVQEVVQKTKAQGIGKKFAVQKAYMEELRGMSPAERSEVKLLNKLEKEEVRDRLKEVRAREKERKAVRLNQLGTLSRKIALMSAAVGGMFALNTKGTLNDVADYKKTGTTKSGNVFSNSQVKTVDTFNRSLKSLNYSVKEIRNSFVIDLLPPLNEMLVEFKTWIESNRELIKTKLKETITGIASAFKFFLGVAKGVFSILNAIIEPTIGWKNLITAIVGIGFATWFAGVAARVWGLVSVFRTLVKTPVLWLITAIIGGLALLVDEIMVTIRGGDSLINDFLKSEAWDYCINKLGTVWDLLKKVGKAMLPSAETHAEVMEATSQQLLDTMKKNPKYANAKFIDMKDYKVKPTPFLNRVESNKGFDGSFLNSNSVMNTTNRNSQSINQRNNFNITVNTPVGTSQEQSKFIVNLVQKELQKSFSYQNEDALNGLGVY